MITNKHRALLIILIILLGCSSPMEKKNSSIHREIIKDLLNQANDKQVEFEQRLYLLDSAYGYSKNSIDDSLSLSILYNKSNIYYESRQIETSFFYDQLVLNKSNEVDNQYFAGKASQGIGYYFKSKDVNDSAYFYYNLSKNFFQQLRDSSQIGKRLMSMALIQKNQNDFFGSKETLTEALQFLDSTKDARYVSSIYNTLATNHRKLLNFQDAIQYYKKAIETTNSKKDKLIYQNNLAATYIENKQNNQATDLLQKIVDNSLLLGNEKEYARVLDNLAYARWLSGKNNNPKTLLEPLEIRHTNKDKRGQIASYTHLGEFYGRTNPEKSKLYFDSVIQLSKTIKMPRAEKDALKFLMQLQPKNVKLRDRYVLLQDSLYKQELKVKTQFAKYKYDDKLKQEDILRLEKENAEQELKVANQRNQKILTYTIGVPLFLLLSFLIYFFVQRSKRLKEQNKTAKLEATYETEAELSKKLHDDFGGKLNHAMLLLQSEANNGEVLNIVDGLYNQSRDFSREINDVDTGSNFKDFLFGMMGNYSKNTKLIISGSTDVDWLKISPLSKKTLFKVIQELMINMQKHSDANLVSFAFEQTKKILKVTYADDGAGASNKELNLKNGLWNTEKRIEAIGGTIIFDSEKGSGFEVQIGIPN